MSASITGGYYSLTTIQICNVLGAVEAHVISYGALRTFFGAVAQSAARKAAQSTSEKAIPVRFRREELVALTGSSDRSIRSQLTELSKAELLNFSASDITVSTTPLECASTRLERIAGEGRQGNRLIPVPRRVLRYLARCRVPSIAKAVVAYLIRGLTRQKNGAIKHCGSVKASWVAKIAGISLRAAKAARKVLIQMGWLSEDTGSTQRKLNRTGAYFSINTDWQPEGEKSSTKKVPDYTELAPPPPEKCIELAPPYKDKKTLSDIKTKNLTSGASKKQMEEPDLNCIKPYDLKSLSRLFKLYDQAVLRGWILPSEANLLFFLSSALRVQQTPCREPIRAFVAIVRRNLRSHVTQAQEDEVRRKLQAYREQHRRRPEPPASETTAAPASPSTRPSSVRNVVASLFQGLLGQGGG